MNTNTKIRVISDIHCEFGYLDLPVEDDEDKTILVLAGDVGVASSSNTYVPFLQEVSARFQDVIYIMGNHEHYNGSLLRSLDKIKSELRYVGGMENVHVLNNEIIRIHDISFVCSTMWASYDKGDPLTLYEAGLWMNDHKKIRTGTKAEPYLHKFTPACAYDEYLDAINFIFPSIEQEKNNGQKVVVVTHHAPSLQSVHPKYKTGPYASLNGAYVSDLDDEILETQPHFWIHGHVHNSFDYTVGNTRVLVNPRGYVGVEENPSFNPNLIITLDD